MSGQPRRVAPPRWASLDQRLSGRAAALGPPPAGRWAAFVLAHSGDSQWWLAAGELLWWQGVGGWREAGVRVIVVTRVDGLS